MEILVFASHWRYCLLHIEQSLNIITHLYITVNSQNVAIILIMDSKNNLIYAVIGEQN